MRRGKYFFPSLHTALALGKLFQSLRLRFLICKMEVTIPYVTDCPLGGL